MFVFLFWTFLFQPPLPTDMLAWPRDSCRLYGEHGIIVETSTNLEDILMSDYFQIEDRCVVQPGRDGGVHVDVEVQVSVVCLDLCSRCGWGGQS